QLPTRDPHVGTCQFTRPLTLHDSILAQPLRGRARTEIFIGLLGLSGYIGDGSARWSAVARTDAARLIRLGLERAPAAARLHAVAEPAVTTRAIAEALGSALGLPVASIAPGDAEEHFGFIGHFFAQSMTASSERTRALLAWTPSGPTLLEDIAAGAYS
ncbi:hypothetical protein KDL01_40850, partial [Actinospica durhamensis]|nr:hypothetical protein [Actinospica durhamensis]